jgi:hypothetical protein
VVEVFAPNRADQSLYEWMRKWHVRNRFDFLHLEYSKIGLPLVESIQRIMIRAEIFGHALSARHLRNEKTPGLVYAPPADAFGVPVLDDAAASNAACNR